MFYHQKSGEKLRVQNHRSDRNQLVYIFALHISNSGSEQVNLIWKPQTRFDLNLSFFNFNLSWIYLN